MFPSLENPTRLTLTLAIEQVLKKMFAGYRRLIIRQEFGAGLSGSRVLEVQRVNANGTPELPVVVKIATLSLIQREWQAYQRHILRRLPYVAEIRAEPVLLPEIGWGGLRYTLMGAGDFEVVSLRDYSRRTGSSEDTSWVLERLLRIMHHIWSYAQPQQEFDWRSSYDPVLPVNFVIQVQPLATAMAPRLITPENLPFEPIEAGEPVRLTGFVVNKVDPTTCTVDLNRPEPPVYTLRCRFPAEQVQYVTTYQAGQILDPVEGQVVETRASRLLHEARQALGLEVHLDQPTLFLTSLPEIGLPNPLLALPHLLQHPGGANVASIHGDFNLENILVETETGMVSLIDFAEAQTDHILHDLFCLETEVVTKLLPAVIVRHHLPPLPTLAYLYWQLHGAAFQPASIKPVLTHAELQKSWAMLITLRRAARPYLFEAGQTAEYYRGLALHLLGALKFKNLNYAPESPLPKQLAFWGAAMAYEFFCRPPVDPNIPPNYLAAMFDQVRPPAMAAGQAGSVTTTQPLTQAEAEQKLAALPLDFIPSLQPLPRHSRMPLGRNPLFVGRREDLRRLARAIKGGETIAIGQAALETAAATGLGGMGKTQLASEFVHRYGQFFAGGVFWLSFADPKAIPVEIAACGGAGALELQPNFGERPLEEQVRLVQAAWQEPIPRLLVFDNCEDPALLVQWRPASGGCRVLVTTRRADWSLELGVHSLPLDVLNRSESLALLRNHQPDADDVILDAIAAELGDLPLALHLAGSYLARYRRTISPAQYLEQLRDPALLDHPSLQGGGFSPTGHVQNVYRTIALSFDQLDPTNPTDH